MSTRGTVADRLVRLVHGEKPDRTPFVPFILGFCAKDAGQPISATYDNAAISFATQLKTAQKYGFDGTPLYFYASYGAWEFGGEVKMPASQWEQAPMVTRHPAETPDAVEALALPDVARAGCLPVALEFSRQQAAHGLPVVAAPFVGVFTAAGNISGVSKVCRWLFRQPDVVHTLMRKVTDHLVDTVRLWVEHFDPAQMLPFVGEPTASNQILSPRQFEEFVLPYQRELHEQILEMGIPAILCHICGDQTANLPHWQTIPYSRDGFPGLLSFDHRVSLAEAIDLFGNDNIILGNIEPRMIQDGTPQQVYDLCAEAIRTGHTAPRGHILMAGCELPVQAPPENLRAMVRAVEDHGAYR